MKDATLEEDGVGPPRSALVTSTLRGCSDYLEARAQQREPFDGLITLERVRRSEEGMADKVH